MENSQNIFRNIPQVEKILQRDEIAGFTPLLGRDIITRIVREETARFRESLSSGPARPVGELYADISRRLRLKKLERLQRVINGTGVIIHTNMGRSPIAADILEKLGESLSGYCNLEIDLPEGERGKRGGFAEELISVLTGAGDALIVNNNASSVFLILNEFARGREVVVSRGELIQIGGGFRIPDIMEQTGARLVEAGTTNITTLEDYRAAVGENTAMIFSAHRSNFRIEGFTESPSLSELAGLRSPSVLFVRDLGSGNLVRRDNSGEGFEPTVAFELAQGPDLVCFSGDKLLGACQAGIIVGRKELIERLRKNPLMRMLRVDKITYFILQETLLRYAAGDTGSIALWKIIEQDVKAIDKKISRFLRMMKTRYPGISFRRVGLKSAYGGGSLPAREPESRGVQVMIAGMSAEDISRDLLRADVPVAGYIQDGLYTLDFRTIFMEDLSDLADAMAGLSGKHSGDA